MRPPARLVQEPGQERRVGRPAGQRRLPPADRAATRLGDQEQRRRRAGRHDEQALERWHWRRDTRDMTLET